MKRWSPARAEFAIAGNPTDEPAVSACRIRDIKRKRRMKDFEIDNFVLYYKQKKQMLENYLYTNKNSSFASNGEPYYWISAEMLP
jgi:hypothetical protein